MQLRPATLDDAPRLREIARAAYAKYIERMGREPRPMTADYSAQVRDLDVTVAERDGEIVGYVALMLDPELGLTVENLGVDPAHQGAGIGRVLLEHAEDEARRRGHDAIALYTHETMTENQAIYVHVGYVEFERREVDPGAIVLMRKPLG